MIGDGQPIDPTANAVTAAIMVVATIALRVESVLELAQALSMESTMLPLTVR